MPLLALFEDRDVFRMLLAPEGTRKKVETWRTGFYYIAKTAKVPVVMLSFDFENKENRFSEPFYPTDDMEADFKFMRAFFEGIKGKIPRVLLITLAWCGTQIERRHPLLVFLKVFQHQPLALRLGVSSLVESVQIQKIEFQFLVFLKQIEWLQNFQRGIDQNTIIVCKTSSAPKSINSSSMSSTSNPSALILKLQV